MSAKAKSAPTLTPMWDADTPDEIVENYTLHPVFDSEGKQAPLMRCRWCMLVIPVEYKVSTLLIHIGTCHGRPKTD